MVTGGYGGSLFGSAELYDPSTGNWTLIDNMNDGRYGHTSSVLANGDVLVTGGWSDAVSLNTAVLY